MVSVFRNRKRLVARCADGGGDSITTIDGWKMQTEGRESRYRVSANAISIRLSMEEKKYRGRNKAGTGDKKAMRRRRERMANGKEGGCDFGKWSVHSWNIGANRDDSEFLPWLVRSPTRVFAAG